MNEQTEPIGEDELQAYVDGALAGERRDAVETWLAQNPADSARAGDYFALNSLLHERFDRVLDEPVPERLQQRAASSAAPAHHLSGARWWQRVAAAWRVQPAGQLAGLAAALVLGVGIGALVMGFGMNAGVQRGAQIAQGDPAMRLASIDADNARVFAQQSAIAHVVYAPEVTRPVEVGADREQELVAWISRRLGTRVRPPVLTSSGFELMGGRLLPGNDGPVAQFMYHDKQGERITLCISHRKAPSGLTAFRLYRDGPVNVFYWIDGDFGYAVSGGISSAKLLALAHDIYAQLEPAVMPAPAPGASGASDAKAG